MKNNKKGFTLAELLIVVAIIAVLVAIAIPVFTSRLEQSRETTDVANMRSAYAAGQVAALSGLEDGTKISTSVLYFNPDDPDGLQASNTNALKGQGTATNGHVSGEDLPNVCTYSPGTDVRNSYIKVQIDSGSVKSVSFGA
jgi:type IV pilus assembly protein PilA